MTISLSDHPLTYVSVPKCACTSLKSFFFEIENGRAFVNFRLNGKTYHVHQFARSVPFADLDERTMLNHKRIAVVRDPVSRIVSCYANKVVRGRALDRPAQRVFLEERKLSATPSIGTFVRDLRLYKEASPYIRHHSRPLHYFLGRDPTVFDRIFPIRALAEVRTYVEDIVGPVPALPHFQKSRSATFESELTAAERSEIERLYAKDISLFGAYM